MTLIFLLGIDEGQQCIYLTKILVLGKPVGHPGAYPGRPLCPPGPNQQVHHGVGARPPMMTTQPGVFCLFSQNILIDLNIKNTSFKGSLQSKVN